MWPHPTPEYDEDDGFYKLQSTPSDVAFTLVTASLNNSFFKMKISKEFSLYIHM